MAHKVYISFKTEDVVYKETIQDAQSVDLIDKSLNTPINSEDEDYILRTIRSDYLSDSTVTIFLIGEYSAEALGLNEQRFIKRELQASLYNSTLSRKSGILGVVLPSMQDTIYRGAYNCANCGGTHNSVQINRNTVINEYGYNYYIPHDECAHAEEDRYCVLVDWGSFYSNPGHYVDLAYRKRDAPIAAKTRVKPGSDY